jgi:uncharacterized protein (UPF0333 family)
MNSRGQAALEYLMTYGWALVIIVVVAGILFFIMSSPTAGATCNSSDPAKVPVQSSNYLKSASSTIKVINGTAGNMTLSSIAGTGDLSGVTMLPAVAGTVSGGGTITLTDANGTVAAIQSNTTATIGYTDQFGYAKTVTITCQGNGA